MSYKILLTGSSGYIGGCFKSFYKKKFIIYCLDKSKPKFWKKNKNLFFIKCDLLDTIKLEKKISKIHPDIVIHLAAQSTVNEKIKWIDYYNNNVLATKNLINVMNKVGIKKLIFSSTAAVYKEKNSMISENDKKKPVNKYGKSKLISEKIIMKNKKIKFVILRFFNVCSAMSKPLIGEFHNPETHLIPIAVFNALNNKKINIFGNDYKTLDGTCERDYIHIKDICNAIRNSIKYLYKKNKNVILNVGNGKTISNYQILLNLKKNVNENLKYNFIKKRKGDAARLFCNTKKAKKIIKWTSSNSNIKKILLDEVNWNKYLFKKKFKRRIINVQK